MEILYDWHENPGESDDSEEKCLKYVGESFESVKEGFLLVAFTRFPVLDGGFRKKVKVVKCSCFVSL